MTAPTPALFPLFLRLEGRHVLVVGAGPVAASKLGRLIRSGADVTVVAPEMCAEVLAAPVRRVQRSFEPSDLDGVWYVVAAAPPDVNRAVAAEAGARRIFVNAVDDPANASAFLGSLLERSGVLVSLSTHGRAPALAGLLREGLDALIPQEIDTWLDEADRLRLEWRAQRVPMEERRPQLLDALIALHASRVSLPETPGPQAHASGQGFVSLVGAGPGAADLLTLRAVDRLSRAQLVLYDGLVPPELLAWAPQARHDAVPRRPGGERVLQPDVIARMVSAARDGQRVVRLKAGDPFVFGRGGEEALALAEAGVAFEVVPGLSSALVAPATAGIPVTHRGVSSSLVVLTGHDEDAYVPVLAGLEPSTVTLVVLMGYAARGPLAHALLSRGWPSATPVAVIARATQSDEHVSTTTLGGLAGHRDAADEDDPRVIVVGDVVMIGRQIEAMRRDRAELSLAKET